MQAKYSINDVERFWGKVDKNKSNFFYNGLRCWEWTGSKHPLGYGKIRMMGKMKGAHRVSYELSFGEIQGKLEVCHHCDNPSCVRAEHLFLGTHKENMKDMEMKGRKARLYGEANGARIHPETRARGEKNGNCKLTNGNVKKIRQRYENGETQVVLAKEYEVHQTQISNIVNYKQRT